MNKQITTQNLKCFQQYLIEEEKSPCTIDKYTRDIRHFLSYLCGRELDKSIIIEYKARLQSDYAISSANSMLAALNSFLQFIGMPEYRVKPFRIQRKAYCSDEKELTKEEYQRLVRMAENNKNDRLALMIQTICGTGIRVSELEYITVDAVRKGEAVVSCKGKIRTIFIISTLQKKLLIYIKRKHITSGSVFVTKTGKPLNRSNIWREMKSLCEKAGVEPGKVFPHNLRHLFARTFYGIEKDIVKLGDILGHTNINTTRIYIVTTGAEHKRKMENMRLVI